MRIEKSKLVEKVWGIEEWMVNNKKYCGKILTLNPGYICSYHHHKEKDETFYCLRGAVYIRIDKEENILRDGESVRIMPGTMHEFASLEKNSTIIEISTHHEDSDSHREIPSREINLEELKARLKTKGLI